MNVILSNCVILNCYRLSTRVFVVIYLGAVTDWSCMGLIGSDIQCTFPLANLLQVRNCPQIASLRGFGSDAIFFSPSRVWICSHWIIVRCVLRREFKSNVEAEKWGFEKITIKFVPFVSHYCGIGIYFD